MSRYERNFPTFTASDFNIIQNSTVCVVGCGGLGGYIIEMLARIGIGSLILIDGDVFEESNLNRQILSSEENIGLPKSIIAEKRVNLINHNVNVTSYFDFLNQDNGLSLIGDSDIVMDALDSVSSRLILQNLCQQKKIPLIHGAIEGWSAQITTIFPGDNTLSRIYSKEHANDSNQSSNPSFTPSLAGSIQVSECIKVITQKPNILRNKLLYIDLLLNEFYTMTI
jgi:molybdopterin/thiamine biosynthesis adenylyltransferase